MVALSARSLKVKDWYHSASAGKAFNAGPVVFPYKEKELIAAPGKNGASFCWTANLSGEPIITRPWPRR